jgi:hypothetical protein
VQIALSRSVHAMITAEQVVANWNDIMERAGCREEDHDERQRKNNRPMVRLQYCIESCHVLAPRQWFRPPLLPHR